jgi:Spy/CpxP family protein refolding chaperone
MNMYRTTTLPAKTLIAASVLTLALALNMPAQAPPGDDPIGRLLFPPELVMSHQQELGLQESQKTAIMAEIQKAQTKFTELQWKLSAEGEKLKQLLSASPVDETKVLEQVDRVLGQEREIKKAQITLLIRIKNSLTDQQRAKLMEIRKSPGS